jgi:pimeloyl-ACP methyl ester carboxylesterase
MRNLTLLLCAIVAAFLAGCGSADDEAALIMPAGGEYVIREAEKGTVLLILESHPFNSGSVLSGLRRAAIHAAKFGECSAAAFYVADFQKAESWLKRECRQRQEEGGKARVVLAGHSWGATECAEMAKRLLKSDPKITIELLVTIDAIKSGTFGATTGITSNLLLLNNPIPVTGGYFAAYDNAPRVDGKRLRAHVNYYQTRTALYHGGAMSGASENHPVSGKLINAVNHGNLDDYVYPMLMADFAAAIRGGGR